MSFIQRSKLTRRGLLAGAAMTAAATRVTTAQEGTPERPQPVPPQASPDTDSELNAALIGLLSMAPDVLAVPDHPLQLAQFGDVAAQLAALGKEQPTSTEDPAMEGWIQTTQWITLPQEVQTRGIQPEFRELFGFDLFQVDRGLALGEPPTMLTLMQGRFDENELRTAWTNSGYRELDEGGATVFSLAEGPEIDMQNPVNQLVLANYNNITILADGTLALTSSLDSIRRVLAVAAGQAPSLAENDLVAALLATVDHPLAAAFILDGETFAGGMVIDPRMSPEQIERLQEELAQGGEVPPARLALLGVTPGGPIFPSTNEPDATPTATDNPAFWVIRLLMASAASAETAAESISNRIATLSSLALNQPYSDLITVRRSEAISDPPAVALDIDFVVGETHPSFWFQSLYRRDLLFLTSS